jgi:hypothetical protein
MIDVTTRPESEAESLDDELLSEGKRQLPELSTSALLNEALRRLVEEERERRRQARERLRRMHGEGLFDYSALDAADE